MKPNENRATRRARLKARDQDFSRQLASVPEDQDSAPVAVQKKTIDMEKMKKVLGGLISFLMIPYRKRQLIMLSIAEWFLLPLAIFLTTCMIAVKNLKETFGGKKPTRDENIYILIFFLTLRLLGYGYATLALPRWFFTGESPFNNEWKKLTFS